MHVCGSNIRIYKLTILQPALAPSPVWFVSVQAIQRDKNQEGESDKRDTMHAKPSRSYLVVVAQNLVILFL